MNWRGIAGCSDWRHAETTDYAYACSLNQYMQMAPVGEGGEIIVLGDEPHLMLLASLDGDDGFILVRVVFKNADLTLDMCLRSAVAAAEAPFGEFAYRSSGEPHVLFDAAADRLGRAENDLRFALEPGEYFCRTAHSRRGRDFSCIVHYVMK
jgi:hypothetical protein